MRNLFFLLLFAITYCLSSTVAFSRPADHDTVWLSSLDLSKMRQGWGKPMIDSSVTGKPLSISGIVCSKGVGTHASSSLWIDLDGRTDKFLASAGVDDDAANQPGSVIFKILADGNKLWESSVLKPGQPAVPVEVNLTNLRKIILMVTDAGDGIAYDHADWANARFVVRGKAPRVSDPPAEKSVVLTPKPGPKPRINGARIFGVRPGSPFMLTIPATGERPMKFSVENLPAGLSVDPSSGLITGTLHKRGRYTVTLKAANSKGVAARDFRIVCGDTLALTPHMGWNSWYVWEAHVTDSNMRAAANAMVSTGMINHGYMYVNIDDCWAVKPGSDDPALGGDSRNTEGMVNPNKRFPDMKALTDYIHSKGLKAGIYTSPGPTTCAGYIGAYKHEELDVHRFVEWGFDFLKYDWCSYGDIAKGSTLEELQKPYRLISGILSEQKRDIVLNLCQYGMGKVWEWGREVGGNSWRTAGDLGGSFEGIGTAIFRDGFDVYSKNELFKYGRPGGWNDPDYLLIGYLSNWQGRTVPTPLTPTEQYTQVSLWCLVAAPLILSGDITRLDPFTLSLLTNDEVIEVDQDPLGLPGRRAAVEQDCEVWKKDMEDGSIAVGLFNRGEFPAKVSARWADLGLSGKQKLRDLWRQKDLGVFQDNFTATVPRHGVMLIRMRAF